MIVEINYSTWMGRFLWHEYFSCWFEIIKQVSGSVLKKVCGRVFWRAVSRCCKADKACILAVCTAGVLVKKQVKKCSVHNDMNISSISVEVSLFKFHNNPFLIVFTCLFLALVSYFWCSCLTSILGCFSRKMFLQKYLHH